MQQQLPNGFYQKVGFWENILFNFAFNAGYQWRDLYWLLIDEKDANAPDNDIYSGYWKRYGFVMGDLYMRFFFRSMIDAEEKLASQEKQLLSDEELEALLSETG